MFKKILIFLFATLFFLNTRSLASAQVANQPDIEDIIKEASQAAVATLSADIEEEKPQTDLTRPEEEDEARRVFNRLYNERPIDEPDFTNFIGYTIQYAVRTGIPPNTIILVLLLPFIATLFVFVRQVIGIPTLEMLVPIALSAALVATGLVMGTVLLATILLASIVAQIILRRIKIMQLPKMALSMFLISAFVLLSLIIATSLRLFDVSQISFLPVILLVLLSDKIVSLQLNRGLKPAIVITFFTLIIGGIGFAMFTYQPIRFTILLYPELVLFLIPINIFMGRYFGLRLTEYYRFASFRRYVNQ